MSDKETAQRIELAEVQQNTQQDITLSQRDYGLVKSVPVKLDVALGSVEISVEKLFSLKSGEVLSLDKEVDQPIQLILNGNTVATGNLVAVDGVFGIEITRIESA